MKTYIRRRPGGETGATEKSNGDRTSAHRTERLGQLRRRRAASCRMEPMPCGCVYPWTCRCYDGGPSERMVDGYRDAVLHLDALGLLAAPRIPEMRVMWARGGDSQRLVREIAERWELAA